MTVTTFTRPNTHADTAPHAAPVQSVPVAVSTASSAVALLPGRAWYRRTLPISVAVLTTGLLLYLVVYAALTYTGDPLFIPALILVGACTVPAAFAVYVSRLAGATSISSRMLALSALWGGVLGAVIAGVLESDTVRVLGGLPAPFIGLIEESAKLIVPLALLLFVKRLRRSEADGLLVGVAVGVTFAVLETMGYAFVALIQTQGNLHAMDQLLLVRGLLAPAGHAAWTGLAAAALWRVVIRRTVRTVFGFLATFALVVALHTTWDSITAWPWYLALAAVSLGLLHLRLWRIRHIPRLAVAAPAPPTDPAAPTTASSAPIAA